MLFGKLKKWSVAVYIILAGSCFAAPIKLSFWIVEGIQSNVYQPSNISNIVEDVNLIFRQVDMSFEIVSLLCTNDDSIARIDKSNWTQISNLVDIAHNTDGLELYFVDDITGLSVAFSAKGGIVLKKGVNSHTVAHEIGHACGLSDIYTKDENETMFVTGLPSKNRMPDDWGWYPRSMGQSDVIKQLLMYGVSSPDKADISYGDIHGVYYTNIWNRATREWNRVWCEGPAPVGFERHGKRSPRSL